MSEDFDMSVSYGNSFHNHFGWVGQYTRMRRWVDRIKNLRSDVDQSYSVDLFEDYIIAFFQACYHLRDYLLKTQAVSEVELYELFQNSFHLKACRDICNGTKHAYIDKPSVDANFSIFCEWFPFNQDLPDPYPHNERWMVYIDGKRYDIVELSRDCANTWTRFLIEKELVETDGYMIRFKQETTTA